MSSLPSKEKVTLPLNQEKTLSIETRPFLCNLTQASNPPIWQLKSVHFSDAQSVWRRADSATVSEKTKDLTLLHLESSDSPVKLSGSIIQENDSLCMEFKALPESSAGWMRIDFKADPGEHFLGLGERFDKIDQRGNQVVLEVVNGASGGKTYKPIPFFISSNGYAVQLLTSNQCILRLATPDEPNVVSIRINSNRVKFRLFTHTSIKENLSAYTAFCGRQKLPPPWVFGPWKSRDWTTENQYTAEEDVLLGRKYRLAGTVKLIDAAWEPYSHSFTFDPQRWPDPEGLVREIEALGYRLILWISPWLVYSDPPSKTYQECAEHGYFIKKTDGSAYVHPLANSPDFFGSCLDFTNPEARAWWQDHIRRLTRFGADGFKTDFGEQIPQDAVFFDGRTGKEMHNLYPVLYNQATYEAMDAEKHGFLLARSAWDGSQPYCGLFSGDQTSDFGPATGLPSVILAGQNSGLSGFPFWTCDIGGYFGSPTEEVFIRWAQFGAFSPIMQVHGLGKREPWNFSVSAFEIYRKYAQLHMDLFPYLFTYAKVASEKGLPVLRALPMEFPGEDEAWKDMGNHEYCLGEDLLVAPVYSGGESHRLTYLPGGLWRDFWTGEPYQGGGIHRLQAPLEVIPVVAKAGAIIPFLDPPAETVLPVAGAGTRVATCDLRLQVYPGQDGRFVLYDGTQLIWNEADRTLSIEDSPLDRSISFKVMAKEFNNSRIRAFEGQENHDIEKNSLGCDPEFSRIQVQTGKNILIRWEAETRDTKKTHTNHQTNPH